MEKKKIKELLGKQLELLSELSANTQVQHLGHLCGYSDVMVEIAKVLLADGDNS